MIFSEQRTDVSGPREHSGLSLPHWKRFNPGGTR